MRIMALNLGFGLRSAGLTNNNMKNIIGDTMKKEKRFAKHNEITGKKESKTSIATVLFYGFLIFAVLYFAGRSLATILMGI